MTRDYFENKNVCREKDQKQGLQILQINCIYTQWTINLFYEIWKQLIPT